MSSARIAYLVGSGRGGSTLVERVLNSSPQAFALGEFHCLWRLPAERIICACGQPFRFCGFWLDVMARSGLGDAGLARLRTLEPLVARSHVVARSGFSLARLGADPQVRQYLALQRSVLDAVAQASGARWLIDSSKAGPRAWLIATDPNALLLHLHRDAVDVIASWRQPKWDPSLDAPMHQPTVASAALDWLKAEAWAASLGARRPVQRIDYTRLVEVPRQTLAEALAGDTAAWVESIQWIDERSVQPAAAYHSLNGNPDRFDAGPIAIAARPSALPRLPRRDRWAIHVVGGLLDRVMP